MKKHIIYILFCILCINAIGQKNSLILKEAAEFPIILGVEKNEDRFFALTRELDFGDGFSSDGDSVKVRLIEFNKNSILSNQFIQIPNFRWEIPSPPGSLMPSCNNFSFYLKNDSIHFHTSLYPSNKDTTTFVKVSLSILDNDISVKSIPGFNGKIIGPTFYHEDSILYFLQSGRVASDRKINRLSLKKNDSKSFNTTSIPEISVIDEWSILYGDAINHSNYNFLTETYKYQNKSVTNIDIWNHPLKAKLGHFSDSMNYYFSVSDSTIFLQNWKKTELLMVQFDSNGNYSETFSYLKRDSTEIRFPYNNSLHTTDSSVLVFCTENMDTVQFAVSLGYLNEGSRNYLLNIKPNGQLVWKTSIKTNHFDDPLDFRVFDDCMVATVARWRYQDLPNTYISDIVFFIFDLNGELLSTQSISSQKFDALKVYPNPVTKSQPIQVEIPESALGAEACIVSIDGKVNKTIKVDHEGTMEVNTTDLPPGHYVIQLHASGKGYAAPFVVR